MAAASGAALMVVEALIGAGLVLLALVGQNTSVARAIVMPAHLISTYALTAALTLVARWTAPGSNSPAISRERRRPVPAPAARALAPASTTGAVTARGDTRYPPTAT